MTKLQKTLDITLFPVVEPVPPPYGSDNGSSGEFVERGWNQGCRTRINAVLRNHAEGTCFGKGQPANRLADRGSTNSQAPLCSGSS